MYTASVGAAADFIKGCYHDMLALSHACFLPLHQLHLKNSLKVRHIPARWVILVKLFRKSLVAISLWYTDYFAINILSSYVDT